MCSTLRPAVKMTGLFVAIFMAGATSARSASAVQSQEAPHPSPLPACGARGSSQARGWVAACSFDVNDVVEPMKPVGEPTRQAVLRNTLVEFRRVAQATRGLQPGQCPAKLLGNRRPSLQDGREVCLCELVDRGGDQCADPCRGGRAGKHPDLAKMISGPQAQLFHIALDSFVSERDDAAADYKQ